MMTVAIESDYVITSICDMTGSF